MQPAAHRLTWVWESIADCEGSRAKRVLEFLIPILYPEKPTRVTVTVGNTIFGALLGERKVDWGILLQIVVTKLVDRSPEVQGHTNRTIPLPPVRGARTVEWGGDGRLRESAKTCSSMTAPEPDPDQGQDSPTRSDPTPSPSAKQDRRKKEDRPGSSQGRGNRDKKMDLTHQELTDMAHSFKHAIQWMELAQLQSPAWRRGGGRVQSPG